MSTLLKWSQVQQLLQAKNLKFVTPQILSQLIPAKPHQIKHFFETQAKAGTLVRLKPGLYITQINPPSETEIANRLYQPSYISFEYALAYYNILPEMVYKVTNATTKPTREFTVETKDFQYTTIKLEAYTGYILVTNSDQRFQIAEPEKALVDYLYLNSLGRRAFSERLNISKINKDQVLNYANLFTNNSLLDLINKIKF